MKNKTKQKNKQKQNKAKHESFISPPDTGIGISLQIRVLG